MSDPTPPTVTIVVSAGGAQLRLRLPAANVAVEHPGRASEVVRAETRRQAPDGRSIEVAFLPTVDVFLGQLIHWLRGQATRGIA
ncbi:MAG: hypothetical protein IPK80_25190 [Nannocystis sp.]|nr:hypothetical protein [Nannocystis sp.]